LVKAISGPFLGGYGCSGTLISAELYKSQYFFGTLKGR
jgi:hypothetical protein